MIFLVLQELLWHLLLAYSWSANKAETQQKKKKKEVTSMNLKVPV